MKKGLFLRDFNALCADFDKRRPSEPPVGETPWFSLEWKSGNDSVNSMLRRFLFQNGYPYINCFGSDKVWFLYHDNTWRRCNHTIENGVVHYSLCEFAENGRNI